MNSSISPADILRPDVINLDLAAKTADEAIVELHTQLPTSDAIIDVPQFLHALVTRQALGSNCLDHEIALPHVRTLAVSRIVLAIGRSKLGVRFDAEHPAIRLIFLIGVPAALTSEYLRWVAQLARTLRSPSLRQALLHASTPEAFNELWTLSMVQPNR